MAKKVRETMTARPRAVRPDAAIQEAARIMEVEDVGSLPVIDADGHLLGIVTDRDIAIRAVAKGLESQTSVAEVASRDPVTIGPEDDLDEAMSRMTEHQLRRLPVVQGDVLVGMLAQADLAREAGEKEVGEVIQIVSEPTAGPRVEV
jgi:signal-transduction protein with cAMP-binding, CBS, and nucleotidyltransferase domain